MLIQFLDDFLWGQLGHDFGSAIIAGSEKLKVKKLQIEHVIARMDFAYVLMVLKVITAWGTQWLRAIAFFLVFASHSTCWQFAFLLFQNFDYVVLVSINTQVARDSQRLLDDFQWRQIGILQKSACGRMSIRSATTYCRKP